MHSQITGIHKAGEVRAVRSRFSQKSQQITTAHTKLAIRVGVIPSADTFAFENSDSSCVHKKAVHKFQG